MKTDEQLVVELGHFRDAQLSADARIRCYRALAATTASQVLAAHFHQCADDLAAAEQKIGQRVLAFESSR